MLRVSGLQFSECVGEDDEVVGIRSEAAKVGGEPGCFRERGMLRRERLSDFQEFRVAFDEREARERREYLCGCPRGGSGSGAEIEQGLRREFGEFLFCLFEYVTTSGVGCGHANLQVGEAVGGALQRGAGEIAAAVGVANLGSGASDALGMRELLRDGFLQFNW